MLLIIFFLIRFFQVVALLIGSALSAPTPQEIPSDVPQQDNQRFVPLVVPVPDSEPGTFAPVVVPAPEAQPQDTQTASDLTLGQIPENGMVILILDDSQNIAGAVQNLVSVAQGQETPTNSETQVELDTQAGEPDNSVFVQDVVATPVQEEATAAVEVETPPEQPIVAEGITETEVAPDPLENVIPTTTIDTALLPSAMKAIIEMIQAAQNSVTGENTPVTQEVVSVLEDATLPIAEIAPIETSETITSEPQLQVDAQDLAIIDQVQAEEVAPIEQVQIIEEAVPVATESDIASVQGVEQAAPIVNVIDSTVQNVESTPEEAQQTIQENIEAVEIPTITSENTVRVSNSAQMSDALAKLLSQTPQDSTIGIIILEENLTNEQEVDLVTENTPVDQVTEILVAPDSADVLVSPSSTLEVEPESTPELAIDSEIPAVAVIEPVPAAVEPISAAEVPLPVIEDTLITAEQPLAVSVEPLVESLPAAIEPLPAAIAVRM